MDCRKIWLNWPLFITRERWSEFYRVDALRNECNILFPNSDEYYKLSRNTTTTMSRTIFNSKLLNSTLVNSYSATN